MATKPSSPFEWSTSIAVGDDATQRLDFTVETPAWVTNGANDDDIFKHEYANDVFGRISDWTVYLDELILTQIPFGSNATIGTEVDTSSSVYLYAKHDATGSVTWRVEGDLWADNALYLGADTSGSTLSDYEVAIGPVDNSGAVGTYELLLEPPGGSFAAGGTDEVSIRADAVEVGMEADSASAEFKTQAPFSKSLYLDNVVKAQFTVVASTSTGIVGLEAAASGLDPYNADPTVRFAGNSILVDIKETSGVVGYVHASARESLTTSDIAYIRMNANYNALETAVELTLNATARATPTSDEFLVSAGAINTGASFKSEIRINVILF